jgi:hypothetical protein
VLLPCRSFHKSGFLCLPAEINKTRRFPASRPPLHNLTHHLPKHLHTHKLPPLHQTTMDSREVNEIVVKLLAAADKSGEREILHLVGRLSRAATRERSTAFDEMHHLDRKIRHLQDEIRRLDPQNSLLRRSPVSHARSRPMVSLHHFLSILDTSMANNPATGRSP